MNSSTLLCSASFSTDIELFIELAIAIPSMILYGLFFLVYFKSFQLGSSYYLLFFVHSCINIVYFISRALLMRVPSFSLLCQWMLHHFGHFDYPFTPLYFLYHYTQHAQALSIIAINVNRVIALYFYNSVTLLHYSTYLLLVSIHLIPLPLTWHLLISPVKFIPSPPVIAMDYARMVSYPGLSVLHLIVDTAATGVVAGTSLLIIAQMQSLQKRRKTNERSLIIVSLLLSFGLLLSATVQYLIRSLPRQSTGYYFTLNHRWIITDFVSLFPPWSLLLLSSVVRNEVSHPFSYHRFLPFRKAQLSSNRKIHSLNIQSLQDSSYGPFSRSLPCWASHPLPPSPLPAVPSSLLPPLPSPLGHCPSIIHSTHSNPIDSCPSTFWHGHIIGEIWDMVILEGEGWSGSSCLCHQKDSICASGNGRQRQERMNTCRLCPIPTPSTPL